MTQYRKKPVVIEAFQLPHRFAWHLELFHDWADRVGLVKFSVKNHEVTIHTLEDGKNGQALHIASPGDWIIKGVKGEFYPCKPDIFAQTYESVSQQCVAKLKQGEG